MSKEKKYISLKVVAYAIRDFLYALLNNGVSENDIFITKEDDYLVVRLPIESLSSVKYINRNEYIPQCNEPRCEDIEDYTDNYVNKDIDD